MLKTLKSFWNRIGSKPSPDEEEIDIPLATLEEIDSMRDGIENLVRPGDVLRYPPADIGYPALIPGEYILREKQQDILSAIKREISIRDSEFDEMVMPMLVNFANFVQLFPASENHHHRAQSGLMRHSLEVCFHSIRKAKNIEFDSSAVPVKKSNRVLAWRLAICAGGLLHDIGKPFTDFEVWDSTGKHHWPPGKTSIHVWAKTNEIQRYFLIWKPGRYQQHHSSTNAMMMLIMPSALNNFLLKEGNDIYNELTRAMAVSSQRLDDKDSSLPEMKNKILKIIKESDSASVLHDMKRYGGDAIRATQSGVPAIQRIVDAMRYLIKKGTWKANKPGSPVWMTTQGVFIVWGTAVDDITRTVSKSGAVIPQSAGSLADLMLNYHLCIPCTNKNEESAYWRVAPHKMNDRDSRNSKDPRVALSCLRLISEEILFVDVMVPLPVSCRIRVDGQWVEFTSNNKKSVPHLDESQPYIGANAPKPTGIPANVDPEILKGGTLIPDQDEDPIQARFGAGNVPTPENAHLLLRHLNLLNDEQVESIKKRREEAAKTTNAIANPVESDLHSEQQQGQDSTNLSDPVNGAAATAEQPDMQQIPLEAYYDEPPKLSIKQMLATRQGSLPLDALPENQPDVDPMFQDVSYDAGEKLSIWDALAKNEIIGQYQDDENNLVDKPVDTQAELIEQTRIKLNEAQNANCNGVAEQQCDNYAPPVYETADYGYKDGNDQIYRNPQDIAPKFDHTLKSRIFQNGTDEARRILSDYVIKTGGDLHNLNGHLCVSMPTGEIETAFKEMNSSGWIWHPFLEAPSEFYTHRSSMCFYLQKELNTDIDQISTGAYHKMIYPVSMDGANIIPDRIYLSIATSGTLRESHDGHPVIALSAALKKKIAKEQNIDFNQFRQFMIDNFEITTRANTDYILADQRIAQYMVNNNE